MSEQNQWSLTIDLARTLADELAEFTSDRSSLTAAIDLAAAPGDDVLLLEYDSRILDGDLRLATRTRFIGKHYADAVEAGVKALNECIRKRSGRGEDGDPLMTVVFSPSSPILRINKGQSKSDESAQRGHMHLCQGVIGAWRNPRAHALVDDSPRRALMMLETINDLIQVTKGAVRTRKRRK